MTSSSLRTARALSLCGAAALALAACAHKPPPPPMAGAGYPPPPTTTTTTATTTGVQEADADRALAPAGMQAAFASQAGADRVYFDYDRFEVKPDAARVLDGQAQWLQAHPTINVRVEGNADERGTREYNLGLSQRRAEAVKAYLVERGVPASRLTTIGYGKERPIDTSGTEDGMARNRNAHSALTM